MELDIGKFDVYNKIMALFNLIMYILEWIWRSVFTSGMSDDLTCLTGKTAIVTGGNAGIGYSTSLLLASRGCKVIIACRSEAIKERDKIIDQTNNPNVVVKYLDLCRLESVRDFAKTIKQEEQKIDILINNAGVGFSMDTLTKDGMDLVMQSNYFGHFLLAHLLKDLLCQSDNARIVFLTSGLSIMNKLNVRALYPTIPSTLESRKRSYPNSKACCILAAQEMAEKMRKFGITVNAADPGVVETHIFDTLEGDEEGKLFMRTVMKLGVFLFAADSIKAAQTSFHLAVSKNVGNGQNYFRCALMRKPSELHNKKQCEEIWKETEKIVKLRPEERL